MLKRALCACALVASFLIPIESANAANCTPTSTTSNGLTLLRFTSTGTCSWTVPTGVRYINFAIVAGGGGGGGGAFGGGGGGGVVLTAKTISMTAGSSHSISVGVGGYGGYSDLTASDDGGDVAGENGGESKIDNYIAKGGGGGAGYYVGALGHRSGAQGKIGGNQGGGSENSFEKNLAYEQATNQPLASSFTPSTKVNLFGNNAGGGTLGPSYVKAGAGGGGAWSPGDSVNSDAVGGDGGDGISVALIGASVGGGGGGGATNFGSNYRSGVGGSGGGGNGGVTGPGSSASANTGGGGGGAGFDGNAQLGGNGGSGIVVISYSNNRCIESGACAVGDEGPSGGTIFLIDTATSTAYEAAPRYWQASCAEGGLCNIGDTGLGGGLVFSNYDDAYLEADNASYQGQVYTYSGGTANGQRDSVLSGAAPIWSDASLANMQLLAVNMYKSGIQSSGAVSSQDYFVTDLGTNGEPYLYHLYYGSITESYYGQSAYMIIIASYKSGDTQAPFVDDNHWAAFATGTAIGTGKANTALIAANSIGGAAFLVDGVTINGKSDWFVPSADEMKALAAKSNIVEGLDNMGDVYWTSSNRLNTLEYGLQVRVSNPSVAFTEVKYQAGSVRPIRSFTISNSTSSALTLSLSSGLRTATYSTAVTVTATATSAGTVTFYANGKKIAKCSKVATINLVASCSWKPSGRGSANLTSTFTPSNGSNSAATAWLQVAITNRSGRR